MVESLESLELSEDKDFMSMDGMVQSLRNFIDQIASGEEDPQAFHKKLMEDELEKLRPLLTIIRDEYKELAECGDATLEALGIGMSQLAPDVQEIVKKLAQSENLNEELAKIGMYSADAEIARVKKMIAKTDDEVAEAKRKYMNARLRLEEERMRKQLDKMKLEDQNLQTQLHKAEKEISSKSQEQQIQEEKAQKKLVTIKNSKAEQKRKTKKPFEVDNSAISSVTQQFAEVTELRKQAAELREQIHQYEGLPPDINQAKRIVEKAKQQLLAENLRK